MKTSIKQVIYINMENSITDWIIAIATALYLIATVLIFIVNKKSLDNSSEQIKEMKKEFNETSRLNQMPFMDIEFDDNLFNDNSFSYLYIDGEDISLGSNLRITNIGNGLATNLNIYWTSKSKNRDKFPLATTYISKDRYKDFSILFKCKRNLNNINRRLDGYIDLEYEDTLGNKYNQKIEIIFVIYNASLKIIYYDIKNPKCISEKER